MRAIGALMRAVPEGFRRGEPRRPRSRDELAELELLQSQLLRALAMQSDVMRLEDGGAAPGAVAGPAALLGALIDGALRHAVHAAELQRGPREEQ